MRISTIRQRDERRGRRSKFTAAPSITHHFSNTLQPDKMVVCCDSGLAQIRLSNGTTSQVVDYDCSLSGQKTESVTFDLEDFDRSVPLHVEALGRNGRVKNTFDAWNATQHDCIRIDNSEVILRKQSVIGALDEFKDDEDDDDCDVELQGHEWAVLLNEKGADGNLSRAHTIDLRVGCILDGAIVYYEDGHSTPCGLRYGQTGSKHYFGGGNSQKLHIAKGVDVVKVEIKKTGWGGRILGGICMTLSDGTKAGVLNADALSGNENVKVLEAGEGEKIVGFFGNSWYYTEKFGIIVGPKDVELPPQTYDMAQLQNMQERDWYSNR